MEYTYRYLLVEVSERIALVTINRPEALNALSTKVIEEIHDFATKAKSDPEIGGIIVTGAGEKAFVAGADITELNTLDAANGKKYSENGNTAFRCLETLPKPVIAAVNGFALGGGCELAMACHIRIASEKAKFGQPEVNLGLIPGFGGTQRLMRLVGVGRALQLLLSAEIIDANEAYRIGLVNKVVPPGELLSTARDLLKLILTKSPKGLEYCIEAVSNGLERHLDEALSVEAWWFGQACGTPDMKEGTGAFLEKRKPVWKSN
ncbi:MAG: enoyl-CoA hydratase-related protein [bacterium]|nr:enoyl-CoA hydratase-related protein [bacterium]